MRDRFFQEVLRSLVHGSESGSFLFGANDATYGGSPESNTLTTISSRLYDPWHGWVSHDQQRRESTDNELVIGHKGIVAARLSAQGIAAHSAYPDKGDSAIHKLIEVLGELRNTPLPSDPTLGESYLNVGTIEGGHAANVVADAASAQILIRSVVDSTRYVDIMESVVANRCQLEILKVSEPQSMESVEGFATKVVGYGTDIPALRSLGSPLLFGPGSIEEAHTAQEKISKIELLDSVDLYQQLVKLLQQKIQSG